MHTKDEVQIQMTSVSHVRTSDHLIVKKLGAKNPPPLCSIDVMGLPSEINVELSTQPLADCVCP